MCMTGRKEVSIDRQEAFKIFASTNAGLQSPFAHHFNPDLVYTSNEKLRVDDEKSRFFAFKEFQDAVKIVRQGRRKWNLISSKLVVLPVVLWNVTSSGTYHIPNDDVQSIDGYYPAYESLEIVVLNGHDHFQRFQEELLKQYFSSEKYGMPISVKSVLSERCPFLKDTLFKKP